MCMPLVFGAIALIGLFTWLDHESPFFYMTHGQKDLAMKTISKYYSAEDPEIIYQELKKTKDGEKSTITLRAAFTSPKYKKASWILMGTLFFSCMNGMLFFDPLE